MADKQLRMRVGAAVSTLLDDATLDLVYDKLMDIEDAGKIPLVAKIVFSVDDDGILEAAVIMSGNFPIGIKRIKLKSDGKQLRLWDPHTAPQAPQAPVVEDDFEPAPAPPQAPVAPKKAAARAKPVKKTTRKVAGKKQAARKVRPVPRQAATPAKPQRRRLPTTSVADRLAEILRNNTQLYMSGSLTRDEADEAGVDVDKIDGINGQTTTEEAGQAGQYVGEIGDLSDEELAALDTLVD